MTKQFEFKKGHYVKNLIWNDGGAEGLEDNFGNTKRQYQSLKKFKRNEGNFQEYKKIINEQLGLGIVEECERT